MDWRVTRSDAPTAMATNRPIIKVRTIATTSQVQGTHQVSVRVFHSPPDAPRDRPFTR